MVPSAFVDGYERASVLDPALAHLYATHLQTGDPGADAAIGDLAELGPEEAQRFLRAGLELQEDVLRRAPRSLQRLVHEAASLPAWYDRDAARQGCRAFLRNSDAFLGAYAAGAMVEGFSTLISKSYSLMGRTEADGVRWLKQNLHQLLDIFLPRGVEPSGEGWKLTLRIRMAHARARMRLSASNEWNPAAWGAPVSAAHVALGAAALSARLLELATMLGADLDRNDREGIMAVWSCAAHVLGVPDTLLFHGEEEGLRLFRVAMACEPPPDPDAIAMARRIVAAIPAVLGVDDPGAGAHLARYAYRVSRELIGDETADRLRFPRKHAMSLLPWLRARGRIRRGLLRFSPEAASARDREAFLYLLKVSDPGESEFDYELPDDVGPEAPGPRT